MWDPLVVLDAESKGEDTFIADTEGIHVVEIFIDYRHWCAIIG
jgi:hypothetical protein